MAQAPRPNKKATKIVYAILGKPLNMYGDYIDKDKVKEKRLDFGQEYDR